jgi:hypothetical protein
MRRPRTRANESNPEMGVTETRADESNPAKQASHTLTIQANLPSIATS